MSKVMEVFGIGVLSKTKLAKAVTVKTGYIGLLALAAAVIMLPGAAVQAGSTDKQDSNSMHSGWHLNVNQQSHHHHQGVEALEAVPAVMECSLAGFQNLNLEGVADDDGQVSFHLVQQYEEGEQIPQGYSGIADPGDPRQGYYTAPTALCAVYGNIGPGEDTGNNFVIYLPTSTWTQRYVQTGCGGECGSANLGDPQQANGCLPVIDGELATATTDMGHEGHPAPDWSIDNPWAAIDFAYRGVHVTAQVAKAVIENFYGQPAAYSYFDGCSDGGREALMEAQRYPEDFDGIAAGAPANNMDVQNTYHHANRLLTNQETPGYIPAEHDTYLLLQENLPYIHEKVIAACDELDGVADGLIDDPRNCDFNTDTLVCENNGNEAGCLTQVQADAVFRIHDGAKTIHGVRLEPEIASEWGSELAWTLYMPAEQGEGAGPEMFVNGWLFKTFINDPWKDPSTMTPRTVNDLEWTLPGFHKTVASSMLYSATNPNLRPFAKSGGKLILWHGWSDEHISPQGSIQYWESMKRVTGKTKDFARFYLFPGMGHCGGGLGPNSFDLLPPLMAWVEEGIAPYELVADGTNPLTGEAMSRPVYPYPTVARYNGTGSTDDDANFEPYTPKHKSPIKTHNAGDYLYSPGFPQVACTAVGTDIVCDPCKKHR
jgi:hypothetical protein